MSTCRGSTQLAWVSDMEALVFGIEKARWALFGRRVQAFALS